MANPRTTMPFPNNLLSNFSICTVFAICQLFSSSTGHGNGTFSIFLGSLHRPIPVRCNWSVFFARKMHSTSEFAKIVLSKCVCVCLVCKVFFYYNPFYPHIFNASYLFPIEQASQKREQVSFSFIKSGVVFKHK